MGVWNVSFDPKTNTKICSTCRKRLKLESFPRRSLNKSDGRASVCTDCHAVYMRDYARENRTKEDKSAASKRYRERFPERESARAAVKRALKQKKLVRPSRCSECNKRTFVEAHHPNYKKPLDVMWLCKKCHGSIHRGAE